MTIDDRLTQHLQQQAAAITLTPADAEGTMARGRRRRTHRRVVLVGIVAVAGLGVTALAVDRGGNDPQVQGALSAAVAPTTFDWTVVVPRSGLGYGSDTALADGSIYSLSSAPGVKDVASGQHLYRSEDGTEWAEVSMPPGLSTSSLAGSGDALYALGTAPSASGRSLVVATSTDGAQHWTNLTLPADIRDLDRRYPGQIQVMAPALAAQDATHVVAAVQVSSTPDVADQIPGYDPDTQHLVTTAEGVDVYQQCNDGCSVTDPTASGANLDDAKRAEEQASKTPSAHYDWSELDVAPELVALVEGRTYVYATQDGSHFERSQLPAGVDGNAATAVATSDGYRLFLSDWPSDKAAVTTNVLSSSDGRRFAESTTLAGSVGSAGRLGERPAVAVWADDGTSEVYVEQAGGWADLDLTRAATGPATLGEVAFGPLGLAAVLWQIEGDRSTPLIVHSADGSTVSPVPLASAGLDSGDLGNVMGLSVTADGIFVRLGDAPDQDPATPPTQHVLVGTPS